MKSGKKYLYHSGLKREVADYMRNHPNALPLEIAGFFRISTAEAADYWYAVRNGE